MGVPLMLMTSASQLADTPVGRPRVLRISVAPVVACVMVVSQVLKHRVGLAEAGPAVLSGVTVIVPIALTVPQPPVSGML